MLKKDCEERIDKMKEVWKDIKGYTGLYKVSNLGQVSRVIREKRGRGVHGFTKGGLLKQECCRNGYVRVALYLNGKSKHFLVHRLVGIAFIDNPNNLPEINHKDEIKNNNTVENLEWCTGKYNSNYGTGKIRAVENRDIRKQVANTDYQAIAEKTRKSVKQLDLDGTLIKIWKYQKQVTKQLGIRQGSISNCCIGRCHTAGGYKWEYNNAI